ncbi:cytochrome P450 [Xylariales sp. AK1849]|nr:cytochrome P450 [Xylariales sp. AK1849]
MLNSVATCRAVLQTHCYDFIKPPFFARLVGEIVGIGLLFSEGDSHKQQRRLLAGPFSVPSTRKIVPLFQRKAKTLSDVFEHVIGDKPHESLEAQVMSVLSKTTMDIIGVASLGVELGELSDSATGFAEHYDRLLHQAPLGQLISVINSFVPIRRFVPLEASRRFVRSQNELRGMLRKLIQKRVSDMNGGNSKEVVEERSDLLSYMLEEAQQHQQQTGNRPWTEDDIIGHLLNFTAAGHETSSTMLTWSLYALATRHDVQDRLRAEARVLLKRSPKPDYDELSTLPFLNDFCREVLRIYSPSYLVSREAARDLVIEGVHIPKGTQLDVTLAVMHFHPHIWGEDAQVFNPDRRENITGDAASPYAWEPFIQGPRMCPGKNFAMIEIKAILVELINDWRFIGIEKNNEDRSLMTDEEAKLGNGIRLENPSLTYCPAGGLRVRFERT